MSSFRTLVATVLAALSVQAGTAQTVYYVSTAGTARANGLTAETPMKDIQKAVDNARNGDIIRIAEGNYLGKLDVGYIEVDKFVTIEGGYNSDFTLRDPLTYQTKIEPTEAQSGTNGTKSLIHFSNLDFVGGVYEVRGTVVIDGLMLNLGMENTYKPADPSDTRNGCPSKAFETGRMEDATPPQLNHQIIAASGSIAGNVIIRNCLIANSPYFGIQLSSRCGEVEIYNNVIISNRYAGVRIDGGDKDGKRSHVHFHHNTVAFSWCRDKAQEDMGYGYEFMNRINGDVHHNIFLCNNYAAVARTRVDNKAMEAIKVTNLYDNLFFMNAADLQLPSSGGGKWTNVSAAHFEDVDESILPKYENNRELAADDPFVQVIDKDYLKGFASLKVVSSASFDPNTAANRFREAIGLNQRGKETIRVSMFGNRYNYAKALRFFGAHPTHGAQR